MKTVILAGGFGTRLSEYTVSIPKPMVKIGDRPIIHHIMDIYSHYGYKDFYLALGYKSEVIKNYFMNFSAINSDISIDLKSMKVNYLSKQNSEWLINLINTGDNSMTGGRLKRLEGHLKETFFLTYGDGLSNINIRNLLEFHKSHGKLVTVSAVHPIARFGEISLTNNEVLSFIEKPNIKDGWINGGFFVIEPGFFNYLDDDNTILEKEPLERAAKDGQLMAYKHEGFWQCVDTKRDLDSLNDMWKLNNSPWKKF